MLQVNQIIITISHSQTRIYTPSNKHCYSILAFTFFISKFKWRMVTVTKWWKKKPLLDWWRAEKIHFYWFSPLYVLRKTIDAQIKEGLENETRTTRNKQNEGNCVNIGRSQWWSSKHETKPQFEYTKQNEQQSYRKCEVNRLLIVNIMTQNIERNIPFLKWDRKTNSFRVQSPMNICERYVSLNWMEEKTRSNAMYICFAF